MDIITQSHQQGANVTDRNPVEGTISGRITLSDRVRDAIENSNQETRPSIPLDNARRALGREK